MPNYEQRVYEAICDFENELLNSSKKEIEEMRNNGWISVKDEPPRFGCPVVDKAGNNPYIPFGIVSLDTTKGTKYYDAKGFDYDVVEFLNGQEVTFVGGEKGRIFPNEIMYWYDLPKFPNELRNEMRAKK